MNVYLEIGSRRAFACAIDWPGWCRHGTTPEEALQALHEYGPKYRAVLSGTRLGFVPPADPAELVVVERLRGNATTDFGAPGIPPAADRERTCTADEVRRYRAILRAGWHAFDAAVDAARSKTLATGPRGGGRSLDAIVQHVLEADAGYLRAVGWKAPKDADLDATRREILNALDASATGQLPERGPRGGTRWTARYFVRRTAWHVISHAWEIERRSA